jgi:hypothetical protein
MKLRRHEKRLKDDFAGRINIRCYRSEDEIDNLSDDLERVCKTTYQRAIGVGFRRDPETLGRLRLAAHRGNSAAVSFISRKILVHFLLVVNTRTHFTATSWDMIRGSVSIHPDS